MAEIRTIFTGDARGFNAASATVEGRTGRMSAALNRFGSMMASALSARAIVGFAAQAVQAAHALQDMADSTGLPVQSLQALNVMGERAGVGLQKVEQMLNRVSGAQIEALSDPTGNAAKQFERMGIAVSSLRSMSPEQVLEAVGRAAVAGATDSAKMAAVMDLIGVRSKRLVGVLRELGQSGLGGIAQQNDIKALTLSDEEVKRLEAVGKNVEFGKNFWTTAAQGSISQWSKWTGLAPKDFSESDKEAEGRAYTARMARQRRLGQVIESPETPAGKSWSQMSAFEQQMARGAIIQQFANSSLSDSLLRIGGGTGVNKIMGKSDTDLLSEIARNTAALVSKDTAPRLR